MRDLEFPQDALRTIEALHTGLRYDAALAALGNAAANASLPNSGADLSTGIRYGDRAEDEAVRRDAPGLLARLALISMVSRLDVAAQNLLLQRRVIECLGTIGRRMDSKTFWSILRQVHVDSRQGVVALCTRLVVEQPSTDLLNRARWLDGINRVRNCLSHRLGRVQLVDVVPPGKRLEEVSESDALRCVWLRPRVLDGGREITIFPHIKQGDGPFVASFVEEEKVWRVGDQIEVTPSECQAIAMSLSFVGNHVLADFRRDIDEKYGPPRATDA